MDERAELKPGDDIKIWVYAVLVHGVGADLSEEALERFMMYWDPHDPSRQPQEYRFCGSLGFGGKFYSTDRNWWTGCYPEDRNAERVHAIYETNQRLKVMKEAFDSLREPTD